jgi:HAMP domain-containing protein
MNISSTGGLLLIVVAALWLAVFIPGWVKRNEDRAKQVRTNRSRGETAAKMSYKMRVEEIAAAFEAKQELIDPRAWERTPVPAQIVRVGELELPPSAPVVEISTAANAAAEVQLSESDLNEIMRRRRAVG